jgi:hypothetical protein
MSTFIWEVVPMSDWTPLIVAVAALISAVASAVPTFVMVWKIHNTTQRIETQTNGQLNAAIDRAVKAENPIGKVK